MAPSSDHLVSLVRTDAATMNLSIGTVRLRLAGLRMLLGRLEGLPGDSWQDRWEAAGFDDAEDWLTAADAVNHYQRAALNSAVQSLMCHRVLRPSYGWLLRLPASASLKEQLRATTGRVDIDRLVQAADAGRVPRRMLEFAVALVTRVLIHTGKTMTELTTADLLDYADACRAHGRTTVPGLQTAHQLLRQLGIVDDPGLLSRHTLRLSNKYTVEDMVDRHRIACRPVRNLLVRYLTERQTALDYGSLRGLATRLAGTFWADLEQHHPGIDSIRLGPDIARSWQERLWILPDGRPRRDVHSILIMVRSFYLDIAHWAAEDPATWGLWVAPPPVSEGDLRPFAKVKHHNRARMHARTRTLAPALPKLVASAHRRLTDAAALLAAAETTDPGGEFAFVGHRYRRLPIPARDKNVSGALPVRVRLADEPAAKLINCRKLEDEAFWAWAVIEVLRLTGIRIEELLELSHLSIRHYTMADGQLVVLLQIAPSKTDRERVLPVCPELAHALARIVNRVRVGGEHVPLVARYDYLDHEFAAPQPLLLQRLHSGTPTAMSRTGVARLLIRAADYADLRDVDGQRLAFTPHDFRRVVPA
ncbi:tyrosine-type recombinase/integrase [Nocardia amamiensis]|uniref:tyrosine-type recombinase/integrase n=1 Tax=Nocardia amamiensis TaxID=404578 RepID=UPI0012F4B99A|nr:tyrosine-type recombinase/integrase [Nocardia amamiensis]